MNDLTPQQIKEQLLADMPDAPDVGHWPSEIGRRVTMQRRRANALRVGAAVMVLALAVGLIWRGATASTPAVPKQDVVVGAPDTSITAPATAPSAAAQSQSIDPAPSVSPATSAGPSTPSQTDPAPPSSVPPSTDPPPPMADSCFTEPPNDSPASVPAGAVSLNWCSSGTSLATPLEPLEGAGVADVIARYNSLPKPSPGCQPATSEATYWVEIWYPEGGIIRLEGDLGSCDNVGAKGGSRQLSIALGRAFDQQRGGGSPEVAPQPFCGAPDRHQAYSVMAVEPRSLTRGFRCQGPADVELPTDLVGAMAAGLTPVPEDLVLDPRDVWLVAYTPSGDPVALWIVDGWVWAKHLTVSGDPRSAEYLGWEPTPAQLAILSGG